MKFFRRGLRALFHQSLIAQGVTAVSALVCVAFLARGLSTTDYAHYAVVTAIWAIGNAVVGTGTGTRIAKTAAEGARRIQFQSGELLISGAAALGTAAYIGIVRTSALESALAGLCMVSFIFAEAGTSFEIGSRRFNRYLSLLGVRALLPPVLLAIFAAMHAVSFTAAVTSVLVGNIASLLMWPGRWSSKIDRSSQVTSRPIGAINMGLWVIASADRLVLERIIAPIDLASYALAYGLADRVFRSLSNAYIAKSLGRAFQGHIRSPGWKFYILSAILAALLVPGIQTATVFLSDSRYEASFGLTLSISAAGLFMIWSAPHYVNLMASGEFRTALIVVFSLAICNVVGNFLLAGSLGAMGAALLSMCTYALWFLWLSLRTAYPRRNSIDGARHVRTTINVVHSSQSTEG